MRKCEELTLDTSCLNKADFNEPIFVLRANDSLAATTVREWAHRYQVKKTEDGRHMTEREQWKFAEANELARQMEQWRAKP
jgi:hypothetical protein